MRREIDYLGMNIWGRGRGMRMIWEIIPSYEGSNIESNFRYIDDKFEGIRISLNTYGGN